MANDISIVVTAKDNASGALKGIAGSIGGLSGKAKQGVTDLRNYTLGLAAVGTAATAGLVGKFTKAAAGVEQLEIAFTTMLGSGDAAKELIYDIGEAAKSTPFQLPELQNASRSLLAFGTDAKDIIPTLTMLGDVSSGIGAPVGEIAELYGKAQVSGRLFGEDINQLTGRGIPIIGELAKQFGVAESEVKKLVEDGEVGFEHLEKAMQAMTGTTSTFETDLSKMATELNAIGRIGPDNMKRFQKAWDSAGGSVTDFVKILEDDYSNSAQDLDLILKGAGLTVDNLADAFANAGTETGKFAGLMEAQSKSLNGILSNISDNFTQMGIDIIQSSGLFDMIKDGAQRFLDVINANKDAIAIFIQEGLQNVIAVGTKVFETINSFVTFLGNLKNMLFENDAEFIKFIKTVGILTGVIVGLAVVVGFLTSPIFLVGAAIVGLAFLITKFGDEVKAVFDFIYDNVKFTLEAIWGVVIEPIFNTIKSFILNTFEGIKAIFQGAFSVITGLVKMFSSLLQGDFEGMKEGSLMITEGLTNGIIGFFQALTAPIAAIIDGIRTMIENTLGMVVETIDKLKEALGLQQKVGKTASSSTSKVGGLEAAIAQKAQGFSRGGIVGGNSFKGDKILARVNSREMILNDKQQSNLYKHLNAATEKNEIANRLAYLTKGPANKSARTRHGMEAPEKMSGRKSTRNMGGQALGVMSEMKDDIAKRLEYLDPIGAAAKRLAYLNPQETKESGRSVRAGERFSATGSFFDADSEGSDFPTLSSGSGRGKSIVYNIQNMVVKANNPEEFQREMASRNSLSLSGFNVGIA